MSSKTRDEKRKELFKEFILSRIDNSLRYHKQDISGGYNEKLLKDITVGILPESQFKRTANDIWISIEEYYDEFLTSKTNG